MSRDLFLNDLEITFRKFKQNPALVFGSQDKHIVSYSSLHAISTELCHYFEQIFKTDVYICLNIETKQCLLPLFIALWKNKLAGVCIKNELSFKKSMEILDFRFMITDQKFDYELKDDFSIMGVKFRVYELSTKNLGRILGWDMCYALCTSGSTGTPKLVQVPWSCIYPNVKELVDIWEISDKDVIAWRSPYTFDPFFIEVLGSLSRGACLTLDCNFEEITVLQTTPSIYKSTYRDYPSLRVLILGGEILPKDFIRIPIDKVYNIYGITEISCWSFMKELTKNGVCSIGKPLNDIVYKIENDELWIGSHVRKCLVEYDVPENLPEVVFRPTGDLVTKSEEIIILDRSDNIVKIFGNKILLTQIYSQLNSLKNYQDYCIVFDKTSHTIALFLVDENQKEPQRISKGFLENSLKQIERPDVCFKIQKLPISDHGKIDYKVLRKFVRDEILKTDSDLKKTFERLWCEILGLSSALPGKSFTQCGGDSVAGLKLITRLSAVNLNIPFSKLLGQFSFLECCSLIQEHVQEPLIKTEDFLTIRWSFNMKKCIDATPSFVKVHGVWCVCVGSHSSQISLLECSSGRHLWTTSLGDRVESGIAVASDHKRLFTGCYDHHVYCLEAITGQIAWKFRSSGMIKSTPRISADGCFLFCGSYDKQMYCLDTKNGSLKSSITLRGSILATPVLSSTYLLFATLSGECCNVESSSLLSVWNKTLNSPVFSSPCVIHNGSQVLFAEVEGHVHCFQVSSGNPIWRIQCGGNIFSGLTSLTLENKHFVTFGCHDRHIYRLDVTHEPVITTKILLDSPIACAPSVSKQYLACVSSAGFLYIIHILKEKIITSLAITGETFSSPQWHSQKLFFGSRKDYLHCVDFNTNEITYLRLLKSQSRLGNNNLAE